MDKEEIIKKSFQNLKRDMDSLKLNLSTLSEKIKDLESALPDKEKPIYTSRPFINSDIKKAVLDVLDSRIFSMGPKVKEFEDKFADFCGAKHAIALSNGTIAIEIALKSLGIKKGDEIIIPSHTTMPTIEPILQLRAKPVFIDIEEKTFTLNTKKIKEAITKKTKAVMPVHLYGNPANLQEIKEICNKNSLFLIEDCAQAHNARYDNKHVGTFGDAGCFSFYPTKNLTVCGEGGMLITNSDEINRKARMLINHGEQERYNHVILGSNHRLSEIHCAIGIKQLELLPQFTKRRREIAELYSSLLKNPKIILPTEQKNSRHVYHLYVIRVAPNQRGKIIHALKEQNIHCGIHYPIPCHQQKVIKSLFPYLPKLPITERISKEIISLPIYPELTNEQVEFISRKLLEKL